MYVIEAILTARVDELYQGFLDYKELFEEIRGHFSGNKKVLEILNKIFQALGMHSVSPNINPNNSNNIINNLNNASQVISNNQSNVNLFEGFATENKSTSLVNNDLFGNYNNQNQNQNLSSEVNNFTLNSAKPNYSSARNNINLFGSESNNNTNITSYANENKGIDKFNYMAPANNINLINNPMNSNPYSNSNKAFSFIKNKNSSTDNRLINVPNTSSSNYHNISNMFNNLSTAASSQSSQLNNNKSNPNDFTDLFGSLKLNASNKGMSLENKPENTLNKYNQTISQQDNNSFSSSAANAKKGFSFIKKEKQEADLNGIIKTF